MREFELLSRVFDMNPGLADHVTLPPGDDMGAVRIGNEQVLVTVDQLAVGVHVEPDTPAELIARKAMTRSLSDVAAMAARPVGAVVAAALNRNMSQRDIERLTSSIHDVGQQFACPVFGGDLTFWDQPTLITSTILATPWHDCPPIERTGAAPGDVIVVTGQLGGSYFRPTATPQVQTPASGVGAATPQVQTPASDQTDKPADKSPGSRAGKSAEKPEDKAAGSHASSHAASHAGTLADAQALASLPHLTFTPRIDLAHQLAAHDRLRPRSMIDLSDGLGRDAAHLCPKHAQVRLFADKLPIRDHAVREANHTGKPAWQHAVGDGEDYELCFTLAPEQAAELPRTLADVALTIVGRIEPAGGESDSLRVLIELDDGRVYDGPALGFEHHR